MYYQHPYRITYYVIFTSLYFHGFSPLLEHLLPLFRNNHFSSRTYLKKTANSSITAEKLYNISGLVLMPLLRSMCPPTRSPSPLTTVILCTTKLCISKGRNIWDIVFLGLRIMTQLLLVLNKCLNSWIDKGVNEFWLSPKWKRISGGLLNSATWLHYKKPDRIT